MSLLQDWHTHNSLCRHATGILDDYARRAIALNLDLIGFSDHFPYEFLQGIEGIPYEEYGMPLDEIEMYISTIERLKSNYEEEIEIKIGFELDFIQLQADAHKKYLNQYIERLDYILGSVHILEGKTGFFAFDDSRFLKNYDLYGSIEDLYLDYYTTLQNMVNSPDFNFNIISHLDLPKKFNRRPVISELIENQVLKTLELVKKEDLVIEINTSGLRKPIKEQYPSETILRKMYELDIPILLGSDAHHPDELGFEFRNILKLVKKIGYNQLAYFDKRRMLSVEI
ncbi:MAG: histidinol-phosphatase HisJ [Candidatus Heimdallarchaeota archaeon]